ncbi:MAG: ATP-binding protein [Pseudomonadota bacterium]
MLSRLRTALWIYDFDAGRIIWANPAALRLWDAQSITALASRDMREEMSVSVAERLEQHREDFGRFPDREIRESWTLYPRGVPFRVTATLRRCELETGAVGMLVEASVEEGVPPETIRSADALLYTQAMIALFNQDGAELYANPAFRAAFGPGAHFFGRDFVSPADLLDFLEGLKTRGEHRATVRVHTASGEAWHDIQAIRCRDAATGDGAFAISATDVSSARVYQQELSDARDIAEAATRMKSIFLNSVGHEMRTPLNGILGLSHVLASTQLDEQQAVMVKEILGSGERMLALVENVQELVTIDAASINLKSVKFEPSLLVEAVVSRLRDTARQRDLRLIVVDRDLSGTSFVHDPERISMVLTHLVENALKFTETGIVTIRYLLLDRTTLKFEVADTGIGIARKDRRQVFDQFFQADSSLSRRHDGLGIGLTICKKLVDLWGGTIDFDSEPGRGSVFRFTVPLREGLGRGAAAREAFRVISSDDESG